ncbi:acyltransferase family protein [Arthrobacter sp. CAU 1506]|uniref:acyltransferase family protein n=1 Tax=Arthrobacter sp. CAU 1506 TaxID=2560052 RepID=UPI0023EF4C9B|nr:acyltransferase family protein [Arthrobacter sp. CAU 1506]
MQGLRALAVSMVVVYHLWPGALTGGFVGVDVFFVISGYLMTAHLLGRQPRTGHDLLQFWGRRIRRLLPAAFVVLAATAVGSRMLAPPTQWEEIARQVIGSALYVENWLLASSSVDYLAADDAPTPVQHFWSLSVEEQFYLGWPVLMLLVFAAARQRQVRPAVAVRWMVAAVIGVSLTISVLGTVAEPASAYFITPTRIWELAAGGFAATLPALASTRLPQPTTAALGWAGMAAILVAGVSYSTNTPFPGYAALLPVLGTVLVILAGSTRAYSPTGILRPRPVQWLGDASYSIYLWHWPLIVLLPMLMGAGLPVQMTALALTLALSAVTKTHVEDRFRRTLPSARLLPTYRFAALGMVMLAVVGGAQLAEVSVRQESAASQLAAIEQSRDPCIGAGAAARGFEHCPQDPRATLVPDPSLAKDDLPDAYRDGCWAVSDFVDRPVCRYGNGPVQIALVGNSHAGQWLPALQALAEHHGWRVTTFLASRCNVTDAPLELGSQAKTQNCLDYGDWVMEQTKGSKFDLVITSERQSVPVQGESWGTTQAPAVAGYASYLRQWASAGTKVLVIKDPPYPGTKISNIPDCLASNPGNPAACSGTPSSWHWMDPLDEAARKLSLPGISRVDLDKYFCVDGVCPAAIGSVVAYRDGSHITATYASSLVPYLDRPISNALRAPRPGDG